MDTALIATQLRGIPLFSTTEHEVLLSLLSRDGAQLRICEDGECLREGDRRALGILLEGKAQIRSEDHDKAVILRSVSAGEIFDAAALFLRDTAPLSHVVAKGRCTALFLDAALVRDLMRESPAFLDAYLAFLAGRVEFLNLKIRCFTAPSAEQRLALWLAQSGEERVTFTVSLTALADVLGIGRASLYRSLETLCADGLIEHSGRNVTLLSRTRLLQKYQ